MRSLRLELRPLSSPTQSEESFTPAFLLFYFSVFSHFESSLTFPFQKHFVDCTHGCNLLLNLLQLAAAMESPIALHCVPMSLDSTVGRNYQNLLSTVFFPCCMIFCLTSSNSSAGWSLYMQSICKVAPENFFDPSE